MANVDIDLGKYSLGWSDPEKNVFKPEKGLSEEIIAFISKDWASAIVGFVYGSISIWVLYIVKLLVETIKS